MGRENLATAPAHTRDVDGRARFFFLIKNAENARDDGSKGKGKNHDRVNYALV